MNIIQPVSHRASHEREGASTLLPLVGWIALAALAGAIGGIASLDAREFYAALSRPSWAPPGWLFGPVWSVLYVLMGTAAWFVWRARPSNNVVARTRRRALQLFVLQLAVNALWTWLFFAWHGGAVAFAEIIFLWILIAFTMHQFGRIKPLAAWLLVPYLLWVSFATMLTFSMWQRNPGIL